MRTKRAFEMWCSEIDDVTIIADVPPTSVQWTPLASSSMTGDSRRIFIVHARPSKTRLITACSSGL